MDRQTRMLYRQRGSNLRQTVDEDDVLVIRTPARPAAVASPGVRSRQPSHSNVEHFPPQFDAPGTERFSSQYDAPNADHLAPQYDMPPAEHYSPQYDMPDEFSAGPSVQEPLGPLQYAEVPRQFPNASTQRPPQDYTSLSNTQLVTPPQTLRGISALRALSKHVFRDSLARKAHRDASTGSVSQRLSYKLDAALFEQLQAALDRDLCDIADIHSANNALLVQQVHRAQRRRVLLQRQLVQTRVDIAREAAEAAAMNTTPAAPGNPAQEDLLDSRLRLNGSLHQLQKALTSNAPTASATASTTEPSGENSPPSLDATLRLLDPQHGAVARINAINTRLRTQLG